MAAVLARKHRVGLVETRNILDAFMQAKKNQRGGLDSAEFRRIMCRVFDVPDVSDRVLQSAYAECGCWMEVNIDKFLSWYVQNMFSQVTALNANREGMEDNSLIYSLADKFGVSTRMIDAIKSHFDRADTHRTGEIDYDEFVDLVLCLLSTKKENLGDQRLRKFWREISTTSKGGASFTGFIQWYMKYFVGGGTADEGLSAETVGKSFYSSFSPTYQRHLHQH